MQTINPTIAPSPINHRLLFKEDFISIYHNVPDAWIYADWTGFQTTHTIKAGAELLLKAFEETQVYKLINDNTHLTGMRANTIEWIAMDLAPRLQKAGLQYVGWIYKTNSFAEASIDNVLGLSQTEIIVIVFDNVNMAEKWLRSVR